MYKIIPILFFTLAIINSEVRCDKEVEFHFIKTVKMNESDLWHYNLKEVEKLNVTSFKINADIDQMIELDDTWQVN